MITLTEIIREWGKDASIPDLEEINQIVDNLLFDKHIDLDTEIKRLFVVHGYIPAVRHYKITTGRKGKFFLMILMLETGSE